MGSTLLTRRQILGTAATLDTSNSFLAVQQFPDGSAGAPALTFAADLDTGLYRSAANQMDLVAAGVRVLRAAYSGSAVGVVVGAGSDSATLTFDGGAAGSEARDMVWATGGSARWVWRCSVTETGSDVGSNLTLINRHDDGTQIGTVMSAQRSGGRFGIGASFNTTTQLFVTVGTATDKGLVVKGAASQSGPLQQWLENGNTVLASVDSAGALLAAPRNATNNAVSTALTLGHQLSSGNGTTGMGVGIAFQSHDSSTAAADLAALNVSYTNATHSSATSEALLRLRNGGAALTDAFAFTGSGGWYSAANAAVLFDGQQAQASSKFSTAGDSQASRVLLSNATTNATSTELFVDGTGASKRLTIAQNRAFTYFIQIIGRQDNNTSIGAWTETGILYRSTGGNATLLGQAQTLINGPSGWSITISADTANQSLKIAVVGAASTNVHWVAVVYLAEVV